MTEINFGDDDICPVGHVLLKIDDAGAEESTEAEEPAAAVPATPAAAPAQADTGSSQTVGDKHATAPPGN